MASGTATGTEAPPAAAPERPTRAPGSGEAPAPGPGRLEHRLFLAGAVIVALHLVDDSFVQPQPGTSAGDHLVSGLVPLAAVGLAAATYGRLSGVSRAAVALVLGAFGVSLSVEAIHYTTHVGPSGDDFTGFLALPAGIGLLGLGVVTLWRTRNRGGGPVRLVLRRAGLGVVALLIAVYVVFPLVFSYISTHVARPPVANIDLGANTVENVQLHTNDGLTLDGSYVPSRNGAAVIVAFGRKGTQAPARMLARHGYGVLIFDRRGEGRSDGDPNPFAWSDGERDILAAISFLKGRADVERGRIGGLGLSVGGETFLQTAAHSRDVAAVISEGASARSVGELRSIKDTSWADTLTMAGITAGTALFSNATPPPHLIDLVGQIAPRPMFLIYATKGTGGEEHAANPKFLRAAGDPKSIWEIPEAKHVGGLEARPREYEQRVTGFFDRWLTEEST